MVFVGQAVEHRHAGVLGQVFDDFLLEAAILDGVVHAPEHAGGVLHAFLVADLRGARIDVGDAGALIVGGHLEGAAGAGGGLFEDQRDVLAPEVLLLGAGVLGALEVARQVEEVTQLAGAVVHQAEQVAVVHVERHDGLPLGESGLHGLWSARRLGGAAALANQ
ncbi:hypothetical protein D3C78_1393500 [compost metagenome]